MISTISKLCLACFALMLLGAGQPCGGVCFSAADLNKVRRLKIRAKSYKLKIIEYKKTLLKLHSLLSDSQRARRRQREKTRQALSKIRACNCTIPWLLTGLVGGVCAGGIIAIGIIK